ncbi:MAG: LacI family DNA-binding transcriptional regulator [Lentisphaeria bacterium]|nr:LacI family DNA-binding transcriptional regulator [Lentisphaeria bacterium]
MSIVDIAKEAGVSVSTVSRYFNRPGKVSPEAARRIRAAADRSNYQPDVRRPGPKTAERVGIKTGTVAFLSLGEASPEEMLKRPAMPILIGSIQRSLIGRQLSMLLAHVGAEGEIPNCIETRSCDGVILFGAPADPETLTELKSRLRNIPAVWCFREHADPDHEYDHVFYDNRAVGPMAADYLAERGHRVVAVFNSQPAHTAFAMRVDCFCRRASELGLKVEVFAPPAGIDGDPVRIYRKLAADFRHDRGAITGAFFCADDIMLGVHNELRALGVNTAKLDSIGCNAEEVLLRYLSPRPATIDIKMAQIGEMAVEHLMRRVNGERDSYRSEIFIRPELVPAEEE